MDIHKLAALRARAQRFGRRRISEDEVPDGYRVVNTPFGDRLVPDDLVPDE